MSWGELLVEAASRLEDRHEARILVEEAAGLPLGRLLGTEVRPKDADRARLASTLERRLRGEPLQHIVGHWSFRTIELVVDARALVPRPETEIVVGRAIEELDRVRAGEPGEPLSALDLGTGSGAIACALVAEIDDVIVLAVERSLPALELAAENRSRLGAAADRLELRLGDWFAGLGAKRLGSIHCVVANPPYLAEHEWPDLDPVVRDYDPYGALVAGRTGLEAITTIITGAPRFLAKDGALVVEIAPHQASEARSLASGAGASGIEIVEDLAGRPRVLVVRW